MTRTESHYQDTSKDARGVLYHPSTLTCPRCRAFNSNRRCGCTSSPSTIDIDSIDITLPL